MPSNYSSKVLDINRLDLENYYDELPLWSAKFGIKLMEAIDYYNVSKALDIGCGAGFPLLEMAQRLGPDTELHGIDLWDKGIERVRQKIDYYGLKNVIVTKASALQLPFDNNFFDLIFSNNGINNTGDEAKAFQEAARVCKEGASLVFSFNLSGTMKEFYDEFKKVLLDFGLPGNIEKVDDHIYSKRKPLSEMVDMAENAGFHTVELNKGYFSWKFSNASSFFNHFFIRLSFLKPWLELSGDEPDKLFEKLENALNEKSKNRGLSMSVPFAIVKCKKI